MLGRVYSGMINGIEATLVEIEVDMVHGLPSFTIVGLPDTAVRESRERVRAALRNGGFKFPSKKITVNMAPANVRKEGALYDLPVAVSILCAEGIIPRDGIEDYLAIGELSLDGHIKPVRGVLSVAILARDKGFRGLLLPMENAPEAALIEGIDIYGVGSISEIIEFFAGRMELKPYRSDRNGIFVNRCIHSEDLSEVKGQDFAKRALEVAAAGGHNILMIGPPGSGKTMLAKRIPSILPDMDFDEIIDTTRIYSLAGSLDRDRPVLSARPFRSPHHTISYAGMAGGGNVPGPGEISLAHNGVLFLDELPEYRRDVLEVLRQPVEEGNITISRAGYSVTYPARFILVCAMNPCPCGYFMDREEECRCTPLQIQRYRSRISGPLLDRIDIHISIPRVPVRDMISPGVAETSDMVRKRVNMARNIQRERYRDINGVSCNGELKGIFIKKFCEIDSRARNLLEGAITRLKLSARAYDRILKVARTIADLVPREDIQPQDISEAIGYRMLDRNADI